MPNESAEARAATREKLSRGLKYMPKKRTGRIVRTFGSDANGNVTWDTGAGPKVVRRAVVVDTQGREIASCQAGDHRLLREEFRAALRGGAVVVEGR